MSKAKIQRFEDIRSSGVTNMFNVTEVIRLGGGMLDKKDLIDIMTDDNYSKYLEQFGVERNG